MKFGGEAHYPHAMKFVVIIPDGGADLPLEQLRGKTPFEAAEMPHTRGLAHGGKVGCAWTTPEGFEAGSDVCSMSLLGYDPARYHTGRAPLEAAALGLTLGMSDWVFRLNFVTTGLGEGRDNEAAGSAGKMLDHSAGAISDEEARELLGDLVVHWRERVPELVQDIELHPGVSYRNIMVDHSGTDYLDLVTTPPHAIPGELWEQHLPKSALAMSTAEVGRCAGVEKLRGLMELSAAYLPGHRVNIARRAAGKRMATMAWLWGQGTKPSVPSFQERFGLRGAMITSVDLLRGIASYIGWERIEVPGLTSYHDTDYAAQGQATIDALSHYDVVCCHIEAPDEASHQGDWKTKVASLEAIDREIVGPVHAALAKRFGDPEQDGSSMGASKSVGKSVGKGASKGWRLLIMPDHYTLCSTRKHDATPVPFLIAGAWMRSVVRRDFTESSAHDSDLKIEDGHELMEYFLRGNRADVPAR